MSFLLEKKEPCGRLLHRLKTEPKYFQDTQNGLKDFEVRRNDRDYQAGDLLELAEWTPEGFTGRTLTLRIKYLLDDARFCKEGYVVLGTEEC
ncbi:DUF3850 domain-containing protein [Oscillibacter sp.]|uniref:DUF3850 domain-containing protein n=1 Tax=Oscillibacter sp. TaxID=1945593 RepID=UPI0025F7390B|nr:DUF3850 domain-containing protein [Oscillibacter sp.]